MRLREAILCLLMVSHLASEQWVMIARKRLDLQRDGEQRKSDDDNDDEEEEEDTQPFSHRKTPSMTPTLSSLIPDVKKRKSKGEMN